MEEQLINFETAKLAKKKGFNEPCLRGLKDNSLLFVNYNDEEGVLSDKHWLTNYEDGKTMKNYHTIPTQSLLQKWLREEYNIEVEVYKTIEDLTGNNYGCNGILWYSNKSTSDLFNIYNKSYEKVLEEGLFKALESIKI